MCNFTLPTGNKRWTRLRIPAFVGYIIEHHTQPRLQTGNCKNLSNLHLILVPVGLGAPMPSLKLAFYPLLKSLSWWSLLPESTSWLLPLCFSNPTRGMVPRDSFPHYFNPLFAFNLFSRAVSTTVAHCQERKSHHSWMVGTKPVQLPKQYYFHMPFSSVWLDFGKGFQLV